MKFTRKITLMIIVIVILGLINIFPTLTLGKEINTFDNGGGQPSVEIELYGDSGTAIDSTTYFSIPIHKGKIQEASLQITCTPNKYGDTFLNPRLDVGIDGDYEWKYSGKGYGSIGHQDEFTTGMNRKMVAMGNKLKNTDTNIYLPESAFVTDASMEIVGGNLKYGEVYIGVVRNNGEVHFIKSNMGTRQFETQPTYNTLVGSVGSNSYGIGLGDFDNDGDYDIVVNQGFWTSATGNIYLFEKTGSGKAFKKTPKLVGTTSSSRNTDFAVGDFNNDGNEDFIESIMGSTIYFFKGYGNNSFTSSEVTKSFSGGSAYGKDTADFNVDGNLDFVAGGTTSGTVYIFEGKGDGTFVKPPISVNSGTSWGTECVAAGDVNLDGNPDIVAKDGWWSNSQFTALKGNGDSTFKNPDNINIQFSNWDPQADMFDFDLDGYQDLVTCDSSGNLYCYWGKGVNYFDTINPTNLGSYGWGVSGIVTPPSLLLGGCDNLKVDIGSDGGEPDFSFTGAITSNEPVPDHEHPNKLKNVLNGILSDPPENLRRITDDYGNNLIEIPIKFTADEMGNVLLQNLSIRYSYTATVDINPNTGNLVNELNDLIPSKGKGEFRVYFSFKSDSPGKAKFSDLFIKFNEAPSTKSIPEFNIEEGSDYQKLANLALYFNDDEELPEELKYSVLSYTNNDKIKITIKDDTWLHVNATIDPDWHGQSEIVVTAKDQGKGVTKSNEFTIHVNPVNDPPRVGKRLENIEIKPKSIFDKIDLDASEKRYFYDIDSTEMYFKVVIFDEDNSGKFNGYLYLSIDNDTNLLTIRSLNLPKDRIPVRIYCSDRKEIRTMNLTQLINSIPAYQHILINITELGFGEKTTYPPKWKDIEDIVIPEDEAKLNWINLNNYTKDADDLPEELTYSIESVNNSAYVNVFIETSKDKTKNILNIIPELDYEGEAFVTLRVEDDDHNYAFEQFKVSIIPKPDIPQIQILSPSNNAIVSGMVIISGSSYDAENELDKVEVKIGNGTWQPAEGLQYWSFTWDSSEITIASDIVEIKARVVDLDKSYSTYDSINLQIKNINIDSDHDNFPDIYDACPSDPLNWLDSDGDGFGDNTDVFPDDPTQWEDLDNDGYGDNPAGNAYDQFPYDPTQWKDSDGDGLGDNPDGNNPDPNPKNPSTIGKEDEDVARIYTAENAPWIGLILLIIIDLLILTYYIQYRKKFMAEQENENIDIKKSGNSKPK